MSVTWARVQLNGHEVAVAEPPGGPKPRFALLWLHDHDGRLPDDVPALSELRLACVAPLTGASWWADRICPPFDATVTPERFVLDCVAPFVRERWNLSAQAVGLAGEGMGGQGALRMAFKHPRVFAVVAALRAAVDHHELYHGGTLLDEMYDSKEQCRQDTAVLHVHPADQPAHLYFACPPDDPWLRGNDRLHEKLQALGVSHEADLTGSPPADVALDRAVRFVYAGLVQQGRRLL